MTSSFSFIGRKRTSPPLRSLILTSILILLASGCLAWAGYRKLVAIDYENTLMGYQKQADMGALLIRQKMDGLVDQNAALAHKPTVKSLAAQGNWNGALENCADVIAATPDLVQLTFLDTQGKVTAVWPATVAARPRVVSFMPNVGPTASDRSYAVKWFADAANADKAFVSVIDESNVLYEGASHPESYLLIANRLTDDSGKAVGTLAMRLRANGFTELLKSLNRQTGMSASIQFSEPGLGLYVFEDDTDTAQDGPWTRRLDRLNGHSAAYVLAPVSGSSWSLRLDEMSSPSREAASRRQGVSLMVLAGLLVVEAIILVWVLRRRTR